MTFLRPTALDEKPVRASRKVESLGLLMMLEYSSDSTRELGVREPHFRVFEEFRHTSYAERYELFCQRLVRERLYNAACFLTSDGNSGLLGKFIEPSQELSFRNFAGSLIGHVSGVVNATQR